MATIKTPARNEVPSRDCWDLSSLYPNVETWEADFKLLESRIGQYEQYRGKLATSAALLAECLCFDREIERLSERLGTYAFLRTAEDQANQAAQALVARYQNLSVRTNQIASYFRPEVLAIPADSMSQFMDDPVLSEFRLVLERITRYREHTLTNSEENLLAMQGEMAQTASKAFRQLNDADLKFGIVENEKGQSIELSNATFSQLLISPAREVRKTAFHQYYAQFAAHENTLAATLAGSIHTDAYYAKARRYPSSLAAALFPDNVPQSVYDHLITALRSNSPRWACACRATASSSTATCSCAKCSAPRARPSRASRSRCCIPVWTSTNAWAR